MTALHHLPQHDYWHPPAAALHQNVAAWIEALESPRARRLDSFKDVYVAACALLGREPKWSAE